jgi:hypothetical protein
MQYLKMAVNGILGLNLPYMMWLEQMSLKTNGLLEGVVIGQVKAGSQPAM